MHEEHTTATTAADDVRTTEPARTTTVERTSASGGVVARRVVYYIGGVIIALIALRFVFLLLGASRSSGFVDFIYNVSSIFVAPFNGIFGEPTFGSSYFDSSALVAIVIYALLTVGIGKLFTLNRSTR